MTKTLLSVAAWAFLGWLCGLWLGAATGWGVFSFGLLIMILVSGVQLSRISRWVENINDPPPPSVGPWDEILAPVYRTLRRNRRDLARLHHSVQGILLAAEALPDGAITLNSQMELTWCNQMASEHIGLDPQTDKQHSIFNIFRVPEFARYARQRDWPAPILIHTHNNGQSRSLLVQMTRYGHGDYLIVTRDVTQVEKLETMRKDFVANVSHELRTPLTVLSGFLETVHETPRELITEEQRNHYLNLMREQTFRMQATVADLLTLSALESTPHANGKPVVLANLIATSLDQARSISAGRHEFIVDVDADLHLIGVESELVSAVTNLITNAVHYTPNDGTITVTWQRQDDGGAVFSVRDTGIGIASQDIPRLTERFYRADRGRSREKGGTGLGLAITRHVALRHNTELKVESRLGAGSVFSLRFPAKRVPEGNPNTPT